MLYHWFQTEQEKLRGMTGRQAAEYIWQYYKLWIIGIVSALCIGVYLTVLSMTTPSENWLYVCFANVPPGMVLSEDSEIHQSYADYTGMDLTEKKLVFDTNCYCNPSEKTYGNNYYNKMVALLDGGILDLLVMEEADLQAVGSTGRLLDLQGDFYRLDPKWEDRLVYCENADPDYEKTLVPIGVDLTGSFLTAPDGPYPEGCVVGIGAYSAHPERLEQFLTFFLEDGK